MKKILILVIIVILFTGCDDLPSNYNYEYNNKIFYGEENTLVQQIQECVDSGSYCSYVNTDDVVYYNFTETNDVVYWRVNN